MPRESYVARDQTARPKERRPAVVRDRRRRFKDATVRLLRGVIGRHADPRRLVGDIATAMLVAIALFVGIGETAAQTASREPTALAQHLATGFPLTGAHESTLC